MSGYLVTCYVLVQSFVDCIVISVYLASQKIKDFSGIHGIYELNFIAVSV